MENTHPNVTLRKGETLSGEEIHSLSPWIENVSGEEITNDNPPAENTALPNTSQPLGISQAQLDAKLEAFANSIGQMMSFQMNNALSAIESKFTAEIEQVKLGRSRSSSRSSSEASQTSHDDDDDDAPPGDSREVGGGEDNNDEEDPRSVGGSEPSSSNEQGASNTQQHSSGGGMVTHPQTTETQRRRRRRRRRRADDHCAKTVPANQTNWSTTFKKVGTV